LNLPISPKNEIGHSLEEEDHKGLEDSHPQDNHPYSTKTFYNDGEGGEVELAQEDSEKEEASDG